MEEMQPYLAYLPQVKWFQFTMQRSTRCVSSIADWTSVPAHKQRHFRRPASSSPLASIVFIHLDAEGGRGERGGRRRRDTETKHSPSNSAGPTPTMMMERGSVEPWTSGGKKQTNAQIVQTCLFVCLFVLTQTIWEKEKSMDKGLKKKTIWRLLTFPTIFPISEAQRENNWQACRFQDR